MGFRMVVVPDALHKAINRVLDAALLECPEASPDRHLFYDQLLDHFDQYGVVPEFTLTKRDLGDSNEQL